MVSIRSTTRAKTAKMNTISNNDNDNQRLAAVYIFKITATLLFWALPLMILPSSWLESVLLALNTAKDNQGSDISGSVSSLPKIVIMLLRMLGWAYLALCVGYARGLQVCLQQQQQQQQQTITILAEPIYVGLVSNGGACCWLLYYGMTGSWNNHNPWLQFVLWSSVVATATITWGLYQYGLRPLLAAAQQHHQQQRTALLHK